MVKSVLGDESQLKSIEDRLFQSSSSSQVGLVIGKLSGILDRGFVFDLVPTPANDSGDPACSVAEPTRDDRKKGSKGKSQAEAPVLAIDRDWVAEHARQVSRMLLGGMNVVGVYIWAAESSYKTSSTMLWQTVKDVAKAAPFYESELNERLLIHISYSPRRLTCRNCTISSSMTSTSLRPCDFKMGNLLSSLQRFRCVYNFEMRLPVFNKEASYASTLRDILHNGISCHAKELKGAKALVDGDLMVTDQQYSSDCLHNVELLLPFGKDGPAEAFDTEEVTGIVVFSGTICSSAYLCPKEPVSQALSNIKEDIITSLRSRLDIMCDEVEGNVVSTSIDGGREEKNEAPIEKSVLQMFLPNLRKSCSFIFPRRVLVPCLAGVYICDYLQSSETFEDLKGHCQEMMSIEISADASATELETEATTSTEKMFWDVVRGKASQPGQCIMKKEQDATVKESMSGSKYKNLNIFIAFAILVLSMLIAFGWSLLVP